MMSVDTKQKMKSDSQIRQLPAELPRIEITFYMIVWTGSIAYGTFLIYNVSTDPNINWNPDHFIPGWGFLGRTQDVSAFEWQFWVRKVGGLLPWLIGQLVLGQVMRYIFFEHRQYVFLGYSLLVLYRVLGPAFILLITGHCLLMYLSTWLRSAVVVWTVSIGLLSMLNFEALNTPLEHLFGENLDNYYLVVFTVALTNVRYTSFCLESIRQPVVAADTTKNRPNYTFIDLLVYCFYLSFFFTGPILTYEKFHNQLHSPLRRWTRSSVIAVCVRAARIAFWAVFTEVTLHYVYFSAMLFDLNLAHRLSTLTFAVCMLLQGQIFMVQYLVMFGLPSMLAHCDQFTLPDGPRCISTIYLYSEMWKYFDRGLYEFLKRYIYIPLGGSARGMIRQFFGSFCCFVFIYYWHGLTYSLFIWTSLNFLGIIVEMLATHAMCTQTAQSIEKRCLSARNGRRLRAAASVPLFGMSIIAIYYFFIGTSTGNYALRRLVLEGSWIYYPTAFTILYSGIQTGMEVKRRQIHRPKQD